MTIESELEADLLREIAAAGGPVAPRKPRAVQHEIMPHRVPIDADDQCEREALAIERAEEYAPTTVGRRARSRALSPDMAIRWSSVMHKYCTLRAAAAKTDVDDAMYLASADEVAERYGRIVTRRESTRAGRAAIAKRNKEKRAHLIAARVESCRLALLARAKEIVLNRRRSA